MIHSGAHKRQTAFRGDTTNKTKKEQRRIYYIKNKKNNFKWHQPTTRQEGKTFEAAKISDTQPPCSQFHHVFFFSLPAFIRFVSCTRLHILIYTHSHGSRRCLCSPVPSHKLFLYFFFLFNSEGCCVFENWNMKNTKTYKLKKILCKFCYELVCLFHVFVVCAKWKRRKTAECVIPSSECVCASEHAKGGPKQAQLAATQGEAPLVRRGGALPPPFLRS